MDNSESQEMELLALQNIYDEKDFIVDKKDPPCGRFLAHVRLNKPFYVSCKNSEPSESENIHFEIEYLPPITLFFEFPDTYPSDTCPAFLLTCNWLTMQQITVLCQRLESMWEETKDAILFAWHHFLEDETLDTLGIQQCLDVSELLQFGARRLVRSSSKENESNCSATSNSKSEQLVIKPRISGGAQKYDVRAFNDLPDRKMIPQLLKNYNQFRISEIFLSSNHDCDICCSSKNGSEFSTFRSCNHFFCNECLQSYFEVQIREGNVHSLNCPSGSCDMQADEALIKQLVCRELFEKYDRLLLSSTLESMSDVTYCPRQDCQCPVLVDACGRMGTCSACAFVFCPLCRMAYHGVAPCNFKMGDKQKIFEEYTNGDTAAKQALEKRFGKRAIKTLVEDYLSESWKSSNSKFCPQCNSSIEKTDGCNKMTCFRCGKYFCWLCMKILNSVKPYDHFYDRSSKCYDQLFPDEEFENDFGVQPGEFLNFL